jgi:hypothetical protein
MMERDRFEYRIAKSFMAVTAIVGIVLAVLFLSWLFQITQPPGQVLEPPTLGHTYIFPDGWSPVLEHSHPTGYWILPFLCEKDGVYRDCKPQVVSVSEE